jgi:hypothetical protein
MLPAIHTLLFIVVSGQKIETMDISVYIWTAGLQPTICLKILELDLQLQPIIGDFISHKFPQLSDVYK